MAFSFQSSQAGVGNEFREIGGAEFGHDVGPVKFNSAWAEGDDFADLAAGAAMQHMGEDFLLAPGEDLADGFGAGAFAGKILMETFGIAGLAAGDSGEGGGEPFDGGVLFQIAFDAGLAHTGEGEDVDG